MKILHTADWHIGSFRGPEENGINLRSEDTLNCLNEMIRVAKEERPELVLVSGDVFHKAEVWQGRSHREVLQARKVILDLSRIAKKVIVMRGTPNHDAAEAFEELKAHFEFVDNVDVVTTPQVISWKTLEIAVLPGFDRGVFRAKFPGLSKEDENRVFTEELGNIVCGLKAQCNPDKETILMSHYTVPGCNTESGQVMMLTQFEPILPANALLTADFDLVALGHIHRPQKVPNIRNCYYSGAINAMNFNDEGQERGFFIHEIPEFSPSVLITDCKFFETPYREFLTIQLEDNDISLLNMGDYDLVATEKWRGEIDGKIVRVHYNCSYDNNKALNKAMLEKELLDDGAFMVWEILPEKIGAVVDRNNMSNTTDPEANLRKYLEEKQYPEEKIQELILKARPIIAEAEASISLAASTGTFEPVEIEVKNYRTYEDEKFNFEDISFCTINGQNGAGKSSLFMDAIIDCLYEEPREGDLTGWIRNDEKARSGSIMFTFRIGEKTFRVTRTRARSGKGTLNLAELVDGEWLNRSKEKYKDTQTEIINILGMDSLTFKSCALIMQDQYGLFLQTPKEEKMVVLGNLLGLGIYQAMEKLAWDKAKVFGAKTRDLKQKIGIHNETIKEYGNPTKEIEDKRNELNLKSQVASEYTKERDAKNVELLSMQEAQERCTKLLTNIDSLKQKKSAAETNRDALTTIISDCKDVLGSESEIVENAGHYRKLEDRKKELVEGATLFSSKVEEVSKMEKTTTDLTVELEEEKKKLRSEQGLLAVYEDTTGDEEALAKAEEYAQKKAEVDELQRKAVEYSTAEKEYNTAQNVVKQAETEWAAKEKALEASRDECIKKTELLSESGCVDIDNANCRFLQDALEAKKQLEEYPSKFDELSREKYKEISNATEAMRLKKFKMESVGYDAEMHEKKQAECTALYPYVAKAELAKKRAGEIALRKASIKNIQSNISNLEKRLDMAKLDAEKAQSEVEKYRKAFDEDKQINEEMNKLLAWLDKEKQLPVVKERYSNAVQRFNELELQISDLSNEIVEKNQEYESELLKSVDLVKKQAEVNLLNQELEKVNAEIKELQMSIGALTQKVEQTDKLKKEIEKLEVEKSESAKETADYDILKAAFCQDGIPHQIIRSIIPQLTATANSILGQMTGGKMGIEFKTEKVLKSNSKKEVVTLDIFIEEYGKSSLPYLSKSGGEKVKASLSVILSLAEIKSSSAGIQLGMLFIDEPPFLDSDGIQAYCDALDTIQGRYENIKIMAITHDPTMKARFPQNLDVVKTENGSKVIY